MSVGLIVLAACGDPDAAGSDATSPAPETTSANTASTPTTTSTVLVVGDQWLSSSVTPAGLRLVNAVLAEVPDCGEGDCTLTVSTATLDYDSADPTVRRSLRIYQSEPAQAGEPDGPLVVASEHVVGGRLVRVFESGEGFDRILQGGWTESAANVVRIDAVGVSWNEIADFVGGLRPFDASEWPGIEVVPRISPCVDATTQLAPSTPPGWQQFVLQASPTGTCGQPVFLMMSLVLPSGTTAPGTLVTILTSPVAGATMQPGEPIVIDGHVGTLQEATMADGQPANKINVVIGAVAVDAHGSADVDTLAAIVAGMHLFDDAGWAELVSAVPQP